MSEEYKWCGEPNCKAVLNLVTCGRTRPGFPITDGQLAGGGRVPDLMAFEEFSTALSRVIVFFLTLFSWPF